MGISGKVAILGANGAVGRALAPELSAKGVPYRVVGRSLLGLQVRFHGDPLCEHYQWDPEDKHSFAEACAGAGTVVYLVGLALWKFKDHLPLIEKTLRAAKEAGVRRFLLVSSNWSYGAPQTERVREDHPRAPHAVKGRIRRDQENRVLAAHVPGVFATGVLRMADLYGPLVEASHLWSSFQATRLAGEAQLLAPFDRPHEFVFVPDAAAAIVRLLETDPAWTGETAESWNLGGVGLTTVEQMAQLIFATADKPALYKTPGRFRLGYVRAINPYIRELGEMQYLLDAPLLLDDSKLERLLGSLGKTSYAEGVRRTLAVP